VIEHSLIVFWQEDFHLLRDLGQNVTNRQGSISDDDAEYHSFSDRKHNRGLSNNSNYLYGLRLYVAS